MEVSPVEPSAVKIWRKTAANVYNKYNSSLVLKYLCDIEKSVIFKQISFAMKNDDENCSSLKKMGAVVVFQTLLVRQAK
jgi:hypothetical protein